MTVNDFLMLKIGVKNIKTAIKNDEIAIQNDDIVEFQPGHFAAELVLNDGCVTVIKDPLFYTFSVFKESIQFPVYTVNGEKAEALYRAVEAKLNGKAAI